VAGVALPRAVEEEGARLRTSTAPDPAPTLRQVDGANSFNQPLNKWNVSNVTKREVDGSFARIGMTNFSDNFGRHGRLSY